MFLVFPPRQQNKKKCLSMRKVPKTKKETVVGAGMVVGFVWGWGVRRGAGSGTVAPRIYDF